MNINVTWTVLKQFLIDRNLSVQWVIVNNIYYLAAIDGYIELNALIPMDGSATADQTDFETNYKPTGNSRQGTGFLLASSAGTFTSTGSVVLSCAGLGAAKIFINGTWAGFVVFESTFDGSTWDILTGSDVQLLDGQLYINYAATGTNHKVFSFPVSGYHSIRARVSAFTSGTGIITVIGSPGSNMIESTLGYTFVKSSGTFATQSTISSGAKGTSTSQPITSSASGANHQPVDVAIYDASGNQITTFGGGQQYATGAARGTSTGTLMMIDDGTNIRSALGTTAGVQKIDLSATTANATAIKVDNSAVTQPISGTITANAGTNLNTSLLALEAGNVANLALAQASTTSGQKGNLILAATTTAAPTYVTAQSNPLSLTTTGLLRVDGSGVTQPVSGTVTINALTNTSVVKAQLQDNAGTAITVGQKAMASSIPIVIASDQTAIPASQSGTWTVQPGNTQNTTAWLVQDTATNTSAATAATRGMQIMGVFNTTPATLTTGQSGFLQLDSSENLLVNLKTALPTGTNSIGAVTQATAANLNATVTQGPAAAASGAWTAKITDGTTIGAVKAASTAAAAADPAIVVALSPNNNTLANALFTKATDGTNTAAVKAASTAAVATDPSFVVALSPNTAVTLPTLTKGTQAATGISVQNLKDAGRNQTNYFMAVQIVSTATDALMSLTGYKGGVAVGATTTPAVVTAGKTYRINSVTMQYTTIVTTPGSVRFSLRANLSGVVAITSPLVCTWEVGEPTGIAPVAGKVNTVHLTFPDGIEFPAAAGIGISMVGLNTVGTAAVVGYGRITIHGYEY
jgi:hypothetical protein